MKLHLFLKKCNKGLFKNMRPSTLEEDLAWDMTLKATIKKVPTLKGRK